MDVQLFGHPKSPASRKAERFFKERRIGLHYVDVRRRAPAPGELRKWIQRFGVEGVLDPGSRSYQEQGLRYVSGSEDAWIERITADPTLLRLPLARCGRELTVGDDPEGWQRLADAARAS
jgi:arsenate reductase (glutaredoxin)